MSHTQTHRSTPKSVLGKAAIVLLCFVCASYPLQADTFNWSGDKNDSITDKKNWDEDDIEDNDTATLLIFENITTGEYDIDVKGDFKLGGMTFNSTQDYSFFGGKKFEFEDGGFITNNGSGSVTIGAEIEVDQNTNTWGGPGDIFITENMVEKGGASASLQKVGTGTLSLNADNSDVTWVNIDLDGGTTSLGDADALGSFDGQSIFFNGGTLQHSASNTEDYSSWFKTDANQAYKIDTNGENINFNTALTSSGGTLTKLGNNRLDLNVQNTFDGGTFIENGQIRIFTDDALKTGSNVTITGNGILNLRGNNSQTLGTLTGSDAAQARLVNGTLTVANIDFNGQEIRLGNDQTSGGVLAISEGQISADITNGGSLTKENAGTLTLSGNNSYSGGTTLDGGILNLDSAGALGTTGTITFNGGTLQYSANNQTDYSSRISTAAGQEFNIDTNGQTVAYSNGLNSSGSTLNKLGAGTLSLSGFNNAFTTANIEDGTLALGTSYTLNGTPAINIRNGSTLDIGSTEQNTGVLTLEDGTITGSGLLRTSGIEAESGTIAADLTASSADFNKTTSGTVILDAEIDFQSNTNISGGTLQYASNADLDDNTVVNITNGAALDIAGVDDTVGTVNLSSGNINGSGGSLKAQQFNVESGTISAILDGYSYTNLTKTTSGTVILSGQNTYSNNTVVNAGTLELGANNVFDDASDIEMNGGTLDTAGFSDTINTIRLDSGTIAGTGTLTTSTLTLEQGTIEANLIGSAVLTKSTSGTVILSGNNTFSGGSTLNGGTVQLGADNALGTGTLLVNSGTFDLNDFDQTTDALSGFGSVDLGSGTLTVDSASNSTFGGSFSGTGGLTKDGSGKLTLSGNNSGASWSDISITEGILSLSSSNALGSTGTIAFDGGTLQHNSNNTVDYSSRISSASNQTFNIDTNGQSVDYSSGLSSSNGSLNKLGSGTLTLSGTSTFDGGTDIQAGTLKLGTNNSLLTSGDVNVTGTLDLNNFNQQVSALNGSGNITLGSGTLTAGNGSFSGGISGSGGLTKDSSGTLTLSGSNSFTGDTNIESGTLALANSSQDNSTLQSPNIDISGGTLLLGNSNQISDSSNITLSGGTLQLGGSGTKTETLGTLTLTADSTIDFGGADWTLAFADSSGATWDSGATLFITNWSGIPTDGNGADQLRFGSGDTGLTSQQLSQIYFQDFATSDYYNANGNLHLAGGEVVPVPEPKFYVGGGALLILIIWFERRRRKPQA